MAFERLVLFDIDGTILTHTGAAHAFRRALREVFGTAGPDSGYSFAGRTDPQIARDLLKMASVPEDAIEVGLPTLWQRYVHYLRGELDRRRVKIFPGVVELIQRIEEHSPAVLGLLTGNLLEGARLKLGAAGIDPDRFVVGAFGSDHADRRELPAVAIGRAEELVGHRFEGKSVVIIGDTPFDIACGEHLGTRTIAVGTGTFPVSALAECEPDHLFEDLADTDAVWRAIFED